MRDKQGNVLVTENEHCASACILILAGGAHRTVSGNLGIHRLFLDAPSRTMTTNDVKKVITERQDQLRAYFREMNISERLADDMMMILIRSDEMACSGGNSTLWAWSRRSGDTGN